MVVYYWRSLRYDCTLDFFWRLEFCAVGVGVEGCRRLSGLPLSLLPPLGDWAAAARPGPLPGC